MPNVERAVHLGIIRTTSAMDNIKENVDENIKKARRSAYALFGCGFHGENGLDPETMIHLFKTYITPVLLYGMEVLIPKGKYLEQLDKFQKKIIKLLNSYCQSQATLLTLQSIYSRDSYQLRHKSTSGPLPCSGMYVVKIKHVSNNSWQ